MAEDRLITVAIHTYDHAVALKSLLESEGVMAVLHNVNLSQPSVSSGVRVRIHESDLPLALRIIENRDIFGQSADVHGAKNTATHNIIVPVDFTEYSEKACDIAFNLAARHKGKIVLLHTFIDPYLSGNIQLSDSLSYEIAESEMRKTLQSEADRRMKEFAGRLRTRIKHSQLPPVKFTTEVIEGIPEEVIMEYAKDHKPDLIVMGTRDADKKERELIGSVTAEVLDSCRFSVLTVPESAILHTIDDLKNVLLLSNLDQEDILAVDALYRYFDLEHIKVTIVNVPDKKHFKSREKQDTQALLDYCTTHFPRFSFEAARINLATAVDDFKAIENRTHIDLLAVPNKKKNIFARLFNPSIAHKMLFNTDIPMMVIPV